MWPQPCCDVIEKLISDIASRLPPSSGDDLLGFAMDVDVRFGEEEGFEDVTTQRVANPLELLRVKIVLSERMTSLQDVSQKASRAWMRVAYDRFQASSVTWFREATEIRFVTIIGGDHFFVSGRAIVTGTTYAKLVERFEETFGGVHGPIPPMPGGLPAWARGELRCV